ncbi:DeoR/GlpR family DNA-binding transcription regulator [Novosphingobium guangzhouense]|uniref:DeoR family transcriptional regulator n=1 Tax=Novosphingobium guangzhouense TaxID=1850347 RepID=A0A2K2G3C1_9SPHN|nr:DeoR/GlpR family DNA-binding transcription regulator [Novosphingobium guangzhouense]PNU05539.1 DeoR family transcriptional regulator [Novosphingobium guangzhouense]
MSLELPSSRRDLIASRLLAGEPVSSTALASEFAVSEDAIRRDLRALAAAGACRRVYGGAVPLASGALPIAARLNDGLAQKRALAKAAISLIPRGSFVFLDNGSTNVMAAEVLPDDENLSVGTNSIEAAATLAARQDLPVLLVGGGVDPAIGGCVDGAAIEAVSRLNIDVCLLGACALSPQGGASAFDAGDTAFKRALVSRSRCTIVLVLNDKLGARAPHQIVDLTGIDHVVVPHDAPEHFVSEMEMAGANVLRADPQQEDRRSYGQ